MNPSLMTEGVHRLGARYERFSFIRLRSAQPIGEPRLERGVGSSVSPVSCLSVPLSLSRYPIVSALACGPLFCSAFTWL